MDKKISLVMTRSGQWERRGGSRRCRSHHRAARTGMNERFIADSTGGESTACRSANLSCS